MGCDRLELAGIDRPAGALAAAAWLDARGLRCTPGVRWYVDVVLDAGPSAGVAGAADSRFHIAISATDWSFVFRHRGRVSSLRVTDVASVHDHDDHGLIRSVPPLRELGGLIRKLEQRNSIAFDRKGAAVLTGLPGAEPAIRAWIAEAL
jgi:hypothetical protein